MRLDSLPNAKFLKHRDLFNTYKARFLELLNSTAPSKGKEFPKIIGPNPNDKVWIVGAGAAGLHMALSLKDKGYKEIRIFEKTNRHGGKSYDTIINGVYRLCSIVLISIKTLVVFWPGTYKNFFSFKKEYCNIFVIDNVIPLAERLNAGEISPIDQPGVRNRVNQLLIKLTAFFDVVFFFFFLLTIIFCGIVNIESSL